MKDISEVLCDFYVKSHVRREKGIRISYYVFFFGIFVVYPIFLQYTISVESLVKVSLVILIVLLCGISITLSNFRIDTMKENKQLYSMLKQLLEKSDVNA